MWVGTCLFGLGMSATFPTVMALTNEFINMEGPAVSILFVCGFIGSMSWSVLIGQVTTEKMPILFIVILFSIKITEFFIAAALLYVGKKTPKSIERQKNNDTFNQQT